MKRVPKLLLAFVMFFIFISYAKANSISKISMDIYLDNNGNASITEVWQAHLTSGTEGYHPYYNLGNSTISNYSVKDDTGTTYTLNSNWNITASFDTKKNTYGIYKTGDETDLCWGISKYGTRKYTLTYTINNFIYNTTDGYQILYWQLIPSGLSAAPDDSYIKVYATNPFSSSLDVWGYGNYGGTAYVYDGYIEMESNGSLSTSEYMTMLVKFPANTFNTTNKIDKSFSEVLEMAEAGSTKYTKPVEDPWWVKVGSLLISFLPFIVIVLIIIFGKRSGSKKIANKVIPKDPLPFRDLPCKDDIEKAFLIAMEYNLVKEQTDFFGAMLLKWIKDDNVTVTTEEVGIFKTKTTKIIMQNKPTNEEEAKMYDMMQIASKDGILESNEFKNYCQEHYTKVLAWFDEVEDTEITNLKVDNLILETQRKDIFGTTNVCTATPALDELALHMAGLKAFFKEFSSMEDKRAIEVKMWREYLIYAQIMGVAKEVAKEFNKLYPDVITEDYYDNIILIHDFSYSGMHAATVARSIAESRANDYSGGGGGFSSGGGGGGSFGGGGGGGGFR
jgi:uncharacterized membrane protein YgcG